MDRTHTVNRREFLGAVALSATWIAQADQAPKKTNVSAPNVVFVFADQWRAQATGYAGDTNALTPHLDQLAKRSLNFTHAVSGCPVCCPYRASLMTGQYWLTHGVFMNDVPLNPNATSIAKVLGNAGYDTGYIGKWHIDGHGRSSFIPRERRQGFQFWKALECTHAYNNSAYYGDEDVKLQWEGYDAIAQTREAQRYIREHAEEKQPFALFLSWGPPHAPYETAPAKYRRLHDPDKLTLRPNIPRRQEKKARQELAGYYAHISALDDCLDDLLQTIGECGIEQDTIFVFTSDHGDMLRSQGQTKKQRPYDESIRVPFLLRYPKRLGTQGRVLDTLLNTPDIAPTLLGLCGIDVPGTMEGVNFADTLSRGETPEVDAALIMCPAPFGQWNRNQHGGREYRGIRTQRYTYTRDLNGPWQLFDNEQDPHQRNNLCGEPAHADLQQELETILTRKLAERKDEFLPAQAYIEKWGYTVNETGTVPYTN